MSITENGATSSRFKLLKFYPSITCKKLKEEIHRRRIPYDLANEYLTQVLVLDRRSQRKVMAFAFTNAQASYEICIPDPTKGTSYKTTIGTHAHTLIEGMVGQHIEIFKSFWDFLSWRAMLQQPMKYNAYILNGTKSLSNVLTEILLNKHRIKSVMDFLDNNDACNALANQIAEVMDEIDMRYASQNYLYAKYKDLSDYWVNEPDARVHWPIKSDDTMSCIVT